MSRDLTKAVPLLQEFFPLLKKRYEEIHPGCELFVTHVDRTPVEQLHLFVQGRLPEFPGEVVTWKDGFVGKSKHNDIPAEAIDVAVKVKGKVSWDPEYILKIGALVPDLGYAGRIKWGGVWSSKDLYHFEIV